MGGSGTIAHLFGGLLVGLAGLASLWLCLKIARELGGMLRTQLGGLLALAHARGASPADRGSTRRWCAIAAELHPAGGAGGRRGGRRAVWHGTGRCRRGTPRRRSRELRAKGRGARARRRAAIIGRSRAGAVAVQMGRAARGSWQHTSPTRNQPSPRANRGAAVNGSNPQPTRQSATGGARQRANSAQPPPSPHAPAGTTGAVPSTPDSGRAAQRSPSADTRPPNPAPPVPSSTPPNAPAPARSSTPP